MKARVCPDCGRLNDPNGWQCAGCGSTLPLSSLQDVDQDWRDSNYAASAADDSRSSSEVNSDQGGVDDSGWTCRHCGKFNVGSTACNSCGKPADTHRAEPEREPEENQDLPAYLAYYDKGLDMLTDVVLADPENRQVLMKAASYVRFAIERSPDGFPEGTAKLSLILFFLDDNQKAAQYAQKALQSNSNLFDATLTEFLLTCKELEDYDPHIDSSSLVGTLVSVGWAKGRVGQKKSAVQNAAHRVINAYINNIKHDRERNINEWLRMTDLLLMAGEILDGYDMSVPRLYKAILAVHWDAVMTPETAEEIMDFQVRAEGRLHL